MRSIALSPNSEKSKIIMIFAEGTVLKPRSWWSLYFHNSYIPIGNAVSIIKQWTNQGFSVIYCTSRKKKQADDMAKLLNQYGFPGTYLVCREKHDKYSDIVETIKPDVLIEDDCRSIGGAWQMCITHVRPDVRNSIKSIVVKEFGGIDNVDIYI